MVRCFRVGRTAFFFFESYCGLLRHGAVYRFWALALFGKDTETAMLQDRFYLGEVQYKGECFEGHYEPIVSGGLLNRAREVRRRRRSGIGMKARKGSREYPLSGLARCARGGWPMRRRFSSGKRYYRDRREGSDRGDVA